MSLNSFEFFSAATNLKTLAASTGAAAGASSPHLATTKVTTTTPSFDNMMGDVMYSATGNECVQFKGKLIRNPEARTQIDMQLKKYQLTIVDGTCVSAGFKI